MPKTKSTKKPTEKISAHQKASEEGAQITGDSSHKSEFQSQPSQPFTMMSGFDLGCNSAPAEPKAICN